MRWPGWAVLTLCVLCLGVVLLSLAGVSQVGIDYLYADQWRIVGDYVTKPFPENVLGSQNGHRPVFPGLVHYGNWFVLGWEQKGVLWFGYLLALVCALSLLGLAKQVTAISHAQCFCIGGLTLAMLLWPGAARTLYHSNESLHSYLVLLPLIVGLRAIVASSPGAVSLRRSVTLWFVLVSLGLLAALSFGTGLMVLPGFVLMSLLQKRPLAFSVSLVCAWLLLLYVYFVLLPVSAHSDTPGFTHLQQLQALVWSAYHYLKWLGSPVAALMYHGLLLPILLGSDTAVLSVLRLFVAPSIALLSLLFISGVCLRTLRGGEQSPVHLALACAALTMAGAGLMIVLARSSLYLLQPLDMFSERYFVWSSFYWCCLLALLLLRSWGNAVVGLLMVVTLMLATSSVHYLQGPAQENARRAQQVALRFALGIEASAGRWGANQLNRWGYETGDYVRVIDQLKREGVTVFSKRWDSKYAEPLQPREYTDQLLSLSIVGAGVNAADKNRYVVLKGVLGQFSADALLVVDPAGRLMGAAVIPPAFEFPWQRWFGEIHPSPVTGYLTRYRPNKRYRYIALLGDREVARGVLHLGRNATGSLPTAMR